MVTKKDPIIEVGFTGPELDIMLMVLTHTIKHKKYRGTTQETLKDILGDMLLERHIANYTSQEKK